MLLTQYLPDHDLYMVVPVINGKPDPENEYVFADEAAQWEFVWYYFRNPIAAIYAYHRRVDGMTNKATEMHYG